MQFIVLSLKSKWLKEKQIKRNNKIKDRILLKIKSKEMSVNNLISDLLIPKSKVLYNLKVLKDKNLISKDRIIERDKNHNLIYNKWYLKRDDE